MKIKYKWDEWAGVVDADTGKQVQQLLHTTTKKERTRLGKMLVDAMNKAYAKTGKE